MNKNSQQNHGMWLLEGTIYGHESCRLLEIRKKEQPPKHMTSESMYEL